MILTQVKVHWDFMSLMPIKSRKIKNKSLIKQIGRKRVRHEERLCNVRKQKLLKGEAYVNKKGKEI